MVFINCILQCHIQRELHCLSTYVYPECCAVVEPFPLWSRLLIGRRDLTFSPVSSVITTTCWCGMPLTSADSLHVFGCGQDYFNMVGVYRDFFINPVAIENSHVGVDTVCAFVLLTC